MDFLLIVNQSPWGSELPTAAFRLAKALFDAGDRVSAVFFQSEGVYNAVSGGHSDQGAPDLIASWQDLSKEHGVELMLCSAALNRRLPQTAIEDQFRVAGLIEVFDLIDSNDRVVTF